MAAPLGPAAQFRALPGWRCAPPVFADRRPHPDSALLKDRIVWRHSKLSSACVPAKRDENRGRRNRGPRCPPRRALRHYQFGDRRVHLGVAAIRRIQGLLGLARQRGAPLNDDARAANDRILKDLPTRAAAPHRATPSRPPVRIGRRPAPPRPPPPPPAPTPPPSFFFFFFFFFLFPKQKR